MAKSTTSIFSKSILLSLILISAVLTGNALNYIGFIKNAYAANNYYLGNGVQADTYYTYKIQDHDTVQGQPFLMTIYFKQFNRYLAITGLLQQPSYTKARYTMERSI